MPLLETLSAVEAKLLSKVRILQLKRAEILTPVFNELLAKGVKIYVMTRDPKEHNENMEYQSEDAIRTFEVMGVQVFLCIGNHHRKLAILDRKNTLGRKFKYFISIEVVKL